MGLYDTDSDTLITIIENGTEILASTFANLNVTIVAFVPDESPFFGEVESVLLTLNDGQEARTENVEPYALFGDTQQHYFGGMIPSGENTIIFDLYSENNRKGNIIGTVTRDFTVINDLA